MKKKIIIISIIVIILSLLAIGIYILEKKNIDTEYTNSIYVSTKSTIGNGINYYEINNKQKIKEISSFEPDKYEKYLLKNCYESHIDLVSGKILNSYTEKECTITDDLNKEINQDNIIKSIIKLITRYVNPIGDVTIYKLNNHYYIVIEFNMDSKNLYKLYYYDESTNKANFIYTFENKYVIGIKEKDKFIFDETEIK